MWGRTLRMQFQKSLIFHLLNVKQNHIQTSFIIAHIANEEILDIINSLENKSTGPSSIPVKLLLLIPDLIIIPLAYIINLSLQSGVYAYLLKLVKVVPIYDG